MAGQDPTARPRLREENSTLVDNVFSLRRPKDAKAGLASGGKSILKGIAAGAAGLVAAPAIGAVQEGGLGFAKGLGAGLAGAVLLPVAGVAVGATQIVRGVANTPNALQQERQGKHWDMQTREWIENPGVALLIDDEVTQAARMRWNGAQRAGSRLSPEDDYYALLNVPRDATPEHIKKQYYLLARRWHPDKNPDDPAAKDRFQKLGEAYQVLASPELRKQYDAHGVEGLDANLVDGALFFTCLFGSDRFEHLIGELMIAVAARSGGELNIAELKAAQAARVEHLVVMLNALLRRWVEGDEQGFKEAMHAEAHMLVDTSYGSLLLATIGRTYEMQANAHLGNFFETGLASLRNKGHIMKSQLNIAKSALKVLGAQQQLEALDREQAAAAAERDNAENNSAAANRGTPAAAQNGSRLAAGQATSSSPGSGAVGSPQQQAISAAQQAAASAQLARRAELEEKALPLMLDAMWAANVVDIESTLGKVCERVLGDPAVGAEVRRARALALRELGRIFRATKVGASMLVSFIATTSRPVQQPQSGGTVKVGGTPGACGSSAVCAGLPRHSTASTLLA